MKTIRIRNVPDVTYDRIRRRAASMGVSVSVYLLNLLQRELEMPGQEELRRRLRTLSPVLLSEPAVDAVRAERGFVGVGGR